MREETQVMNEETMPPELGPQRPPSGDASAAQGAQGTRWGRWALAAGALTALVVGGVVVARSRASAETVPVVKADVPYVEGKTIVFSEAFRKRAGVELAPVRSMPLVPQLKVVGTVDFDPAHVGAVGTRIRGLVSKLHKLEGERVKQGDVLAEIESAELGEAQAAVTVVGAQREAASLNEKREEDLAAKGLSTAREYEMATATHKEQRALLHAAQQRVKALSGSAGGPFGVYMLRSPLDGTVVERHIFAGQSVESHLIAYRVADLDHLWVDLAVFESHMDAIRKDDRVEITRVGIEADPIPGRVAYVGDVVDPSTRNIEVRIAVENEKRLLRPGQAVNAIIRASGPARTMLAVPSTAITYINGSPTVFVSDGQDRVVPTPVEVGFSDGQHHGITSGLSEGQEVVSSGVFALKSEFYR
ncbi:efflux RND transporter periplasmic adaptor subunit [Chondromyces crocatus]|uniref:Uncharacterized protein n=1 Tax=Chondromyces crocatus TaxID=52 RepID=A0A0K1EQQ6_CHOCO|nr:efflux RND transporter periplasmic adaptor subunit [Chondromyces crocatus]AKT42987.1 uncharacterized protein CMC5_072150 [Chondromyces crocatus]